MRKICQSAEGRDEIQRAVDWMFLLTVEWFGLPDELKRHSEQLDFGFKGQSNDGLRRAWLSTAVPLCEQHGIHVPAHLDDVQGSTFSTAPFRRDSMPRTNDGGSRKGRVRGTTYWRAGRSAVR